MINWLIYLFETTICLALFSVIYILFFRKETYFGFNRMYLVGILLISLLIPIIRINIDINANSYLKNTASQIEEFRSYYEQLIMLTDPTLDAESQSHSAISVPKVQTKVKYQLYIGLFLIYVVGMIFFLVRFLYLLLWLYTLTRKNKNWHFNNIRIVEVSKNMPAFSFFNTVFIHREGLSDTAFNNVLIHEEAHIKQRHSIDLLLVQFVLLIQWFNPLIWYIQKWLKNTHEFLADRDAIQNGCRLFDYQELLLSQLISIRSVELVNNFNLLSIKKRITMMNKNKSGFSAKLKALLIIPTAIVGLLLFANYSNGVEYSSLIPDINSGQDFDNLQLATGTQMHKSVQAGLATIILGNNGIGLNGTPIKKDNFANKLKELAAINNSKSTILLKIDKNTEMKHVEHVMMVLRELGLLKISYVVKETETDIQGINMKLPPIEAQLTDINEFKANNIEVWVFDEKEVTNKGQMEEKLMNFVQENEKYVLKFQFKKSTDFQTFINSVDAVHHAFYILRNEFAQEHFNMSFAELPANQRKEVQFMFPITLTLEAI